MKSRLLCIETTNLKIEEHSPFPKEPFAKFDDIFFLTINLSLTFFITIEIFSIIFPIEIVFKLR